jgi:hypothetical protein
MLMSFKILLENFRVFLGVKKGKKIAIMIKYLVISQKEWN